MKQFKVGVLGATGTVGQNYIHLLQNHPWFVINFLAASKDSQTYVDAVKERGWSMSADVPGKVGRLPVRNVNNIESALEECDFVFSALDTAPAKEWEVQYAAAGIPVVSNAAANRWEPDVPMLIPEINHSHTEIIPFQQKNRGWDKGFIVVKPNCSLQSYLAPIYALIRAGYNVNKIILTTEQASSGAGRPGVPSLDLLDNAVPHIGGEEKKTEQEPWKILGNVSLDGIINYDGLKISATCTRVPVRDGHMAAVNIGFADDIPELEEVIQIWEKFTSLPQDANLPFAPKRPIVYRREENRPQQILDRNEGNGMAVVVGQLRKCPVLDYKFVALSNNVIRGAAGGGILNAELLVHQGYLR